MNRRSFLKGVFSAVAVATIVPTSLLTKEALAKAKYKTVGFNAVADKTPLITPITLEEKSSIFKALEENLQLYAESFLDEIERKRFLET